MPTPILRPVATVWTRLLSLVLSLTVLLLAVAPVVATSIETDLWVYAQGDTVNVSGDGFGASEDVELVTTDPYGVETDRGTVQADPSGNIFYSFVLTSDVPGIYDVVATGLTSGLTAATQFDPAVWAIAADAPADVQYSDTASFSGQLTCTRSGGSTPQCPTTTAGLAGDTVEVLIRFNPAGPLPIDYYLVASTTITAADCTVNSTTATNGLKGTCTWAATWQAGQITVGASTYAVPADNHDLRVRAFGGATGNAAGSNSTRDDSRSLTINAANTTTQAAHNADPIHTLGNTFSVDWIVSSPVGITGNTATGSVAIVQTGGPSGALNCSPATSPVSEDQATGIGPEFDGFFEWSGGTGRPPSFVCTPTSGGTYTFYAQFTDTDGDYNDSASGLMTVVVSGANTAPTISDTPDQSTNEDTSTGAIGFTVGDAQTAAGSLTVSGSSSNPTLVPNANITLGGTGGDRTVSILPAANQFGTANITITVSDGSLSASDSFVLTVNSVNDAPSFTKGADQTVFEDSGASSVSGWATAISAGPNESGQAVDFIVSNDNNSLFSAQPAIAANGTLSYTPADNANGSATVTVQIHDDGGVANGGVNTSASQTFDITVTPVNDAPVVSGLSGDASVLENGTTTHTYSFTIADIDSTIDHISVSCGTGGTFVSKTNDNTSGSFVCKFLDGPASPQVSAQATDSDLEAGNTATFDVTVANVAPTVSGLSGDASVLENGTTTHTYSFTISDPGADTVSSISVSCGTGGIFVSKTNDNTSGSFVCKFLDGPASPQVSAQATDSDLEAGNTATFDVTVANVAPTVLASFAGASIGCGTNNGTLSFSFTDPGTDTHTGSIDWGDGSALESLGTVTSPGSVPHTYALAGSYTATLTITDDDLDVGTAMPSVVTNYNIGDGILQPINYTGTMSVFKYGSTIPVKIQVRDCDGSVPIGLSVFIVVQKLTGNVPTGVDEASSTSAADSGNLMRYSSSGMQYIYNLATKPLSDRTATYRITISIQAGQTVTADFGLK